MTAHLIEAYLEALAVERGASDHTLAGYGRDLQDYAGFLKARGRDVVSADREDVEGFMAALAGRGFARTTQARRLSAVRQLHRFLYAEGRRTDDPTTTVDRPKPARPLPKTLTMDDVGRMLDTAHLLAGADVEDPAEKLRALRFAAMLELLYATGLRVTELVSLPAAAIRGDTRAIVIRGKGDKDRSCRWVRRRARPCSPTAPR